MKYGKLIEIKKSYYAETVTFVCKGVSNDETRYFMNFVYCEENKLIVTDGKRLHILELEENPFEFQDKTFYRVLKATKGAVWLVEVDEPVGQFPNWKRIVLKGSNYETIEFVNSQRMESSTLSLATLYRHAAINIRYLKDLVLDHVWEVRIFGKNKALMFISDNMTAVIMPLDEDE